MLQVPISTEICQKSAMLNCPNCPCSKICVFQCLAYSRAGLAEPGNVRRRTAGKSSKPSNGSRAFPLLRAFPLRANFQPVPIPNNPMCCSFPAASFCWNSSVLHQEYKYTWIFYGSPLLLWVGKSEDEGEKKQMLMRFLAKLRPLLWMHLKKLKQTAGESQVFPPWSSLKKPSTKIFGDFLKSVGWNVPVWSLTIW